MPTAAQRIAAIADAMVNTTSTAEQRNKLARALSYADGSIAQYDDPEATPADKAKLAIAGLRTILTPVLRSVAQYDREKEIGEIIDPIVAFPEQT